MIKRVFFLMVLISGLTSCEKKESVASMSPDATGYVSNVDAAPKNEFVSHTVTDQISLQQQPAALIEIERKLIKIGHMEFEVNDVEKAKTAIVDLVKGSKGYIATDDQNSYAGSPRFSQVVRIPSDQLDDFIAKVEGLSKKVDAKSINSQDVTEEFIDVEARLATKKELEARYHEILKQAKSVRDLLEVESQLNIVRSEIESMQGRLKYLSSQVSLSTLTLTYYQTVTGNYGFGYRFSDSFSDGWDNFLEFIIGILELWPFIIIFGVLIWLFIRWRRRRKLAALQSES